MRRSYEQEHAPPQRVALDDGATAIMLRRLPLRFTTDDFLNVLNLEFRGRYNFVYIPHAKSRARNVALAFMNFVDHETAQRAFAFFQRLPRKGTCLGSHFKVSQADVQGLGNNLAYFIARSGLVEVDSPYAPRVYENGRRQCVREAAQKHVTMEQVAKATAQMSGTTARQPRRLSLRQRDDYPCTAQPANRRSPGRVADAGDIRNARIEHGAKVTLSCQSRAIEHDSEAEHQALMEMPIVDEDADVIQIARIGPREEGIVSRCQLRGIKNEAEEQALMQRPIMYEERADGSVQFFL